MTHVRRTAIILISLCLWQPANVALCAPLSVSGASDVVMFGGYEPALLPTAAEDPQAQGVFFPSDEDAAAVASAPFFEALPAEPIVARPSLSGVQSLAELFEVAGGPAFSRNAPASRPSPAPARQLAGAADRTASPATIEDVARSLINTSKGPSAGIARKTAAEAAESTGFSVLSAVMSTEVDPEVIRTIARVISPTIDLGGVVSFSIFGMGNFAFVVSADSTAVDVVNVGTGTRLSMNYTGQSGHYGQNVSSGPHRSSGQSTPTVQGQKLANLLLSLKRAFTTYILHPFTLTTLALFLIIWTLWRLRGHET